MADGWMTKPIWKQVLSTTHMTSHVSYYYDYYKTKQINFICLLHVFWIYFLIDFELLRMLHIIYMFAFQADPRFVWNRNILEELIENKVRHIIYFTRY